MVYITAKLQFRVQKTQNMISLADRSALMARLGRYMQSDDTGWLEVREQAVMSNSWFTADNLDFAVQHIADAFLHPDKLHAWVAGYPPAAANRRVGITMAGNIPLVGFHDFLCGFMSGHRMALRLSSKDNVLLPHLIEKLAEWEPMVNRMVAIQDMLKECDAYIATGSNNSARYFQQYFAKYPHIIRRNRTSVAVLTGDETNEMLHDLSHDVFSYFGLGCRNVTQLCVPEGYNFRPLLDVLSHRSDMMLHHKYKNNYDYHLALYLLNKIPYLTNDSVLLVENTLPFSPVSVLHYRYYTNQQNIVTELSGSADIQCIAGAGGIPLGTTQRPSLADYADGIDTMHFLSSLV